MIEIKYLSAFIFVFFFFFSSVLGFALTQMGNSIMHQCVDGMCVMYECWRRCRQCVYVFLRGNRIHDDDDSNHRSNHIPSTHRHISHRQMATSTLNNINLSRKICVKLHLYLFILCHFAFRFRPFYEQKDITCFVWQNHANIHTNTHTYTSIEHFLCTFAWSTSK